MKCYTMLVVADVAGSSAWYQDLLGLSSGHGGREFEMLMEGDQLRLLLHHDDPEEHPTLVRREGAVGNGVLLYCYVDDVDDVYQQAVDMGADVLDAPHTNALAHSREFSLRDPDGYGITVAQVLPRT